jgi:hypothetical protein
MSSTQAHLRAVTPTDGGEPPAADPGRQQPRQRASRSLPTDRIKRERQYEILPAIGRLSGPRKDAVNADSLARAVGGGIASTTVILSNKFFTEAGWITNPAKGLYAATDALVEYTRRLAVDGAERAALELHAPARSSWFWQELEPRFTNGKVRVSDAEIVLMHAANATDGHLPMIKNLIDWLEHIGMITVDDQFITAKDSAVPDAAPDPAPEAHDEPGETVPESAKPDGMGREPASPTILAVTFDLKITVGDLAHLSADQIRALFDAAGTIAALKGKE